MKKIIVALVSIFIAMEGVAWFAYRESQEEAEVSVEQKTEDDNKQESSQLDSNLGNEKIAKKDGQGQDNLIQDQDGLGFPPPSVEVVNGVSQRTIHMGVRQWAWDPSEISANYGEKVILIMHNADVKHSISIPDLNVNADIPEDGAVVMFDANKRGTFEFFCNNPCGKDHAKMKGKITIN